MLEQIKQKIETEIGHLLHELNTDLPARIKVALEHGDLRENAEYKSAKERQEFVQARLNHFTKRMGELGKIDVTQMPLDKVGYGSKVKVRDLDLGEDFDFTIVAGDFIDLDAGHISLASPIGRGLLGSKAGQEVSVQLPMGPRRYRILELVTLPQQLEAGGQG